MLHQISYMLTLSELLDHNFGKYYNRGGGGEGVNFLWSNEPHLWGAFAPQEILLQCDFYITKKINA